MNLHLLSLGAFAAAVARRTPTTLEGHSIASYDAAEAPHARPAFWPRADLRVLITGRPSPYLEAVLDQSVADSGVPAVVITLEHPRLRLGPLLGTGGACLSCMRSRRAQHDPSYLRVQPLTAAYDKDPSLEPTGHLPHHVRFATSWLQSVVEDLTTGNEARHCGQVRSINLHTGALSSDRVVGLHGCSRCRQTRPLAESTWLQMAADLTGDPALTGATAVASASPTGKGSGHHV